MHKKKRTTSLLLFRRDLRLDDNTALINAIQQSHTVIPCFIFDPRQIGDENVFRSPKAVEFMIESLQDLDAQLKKHGSKLYVFHGDTETVVQDLLKKHTIDALYINRDYTPFSTARDTQLAAICAPYRCSFQQSADALMNEPETMLNKSGKPYAVFTPFFKRAHTQFPIKAPQPLPHTNFYTDAILGTQSLIAIKKMLPYLQKSPTIKGGRAQALTILKSLTNFKQYAHDRDFPALDTTTHLSAHLKFGTISVREAYAAIVEQLGASHPLIKQLYWRDFFTHVAFNAPQVFGAPYHKKYTKLRWSDDKVAFKKWCSGDTGFPIVDAGMRELNATGYMHNRVRMITASFLVKDLHINWQWGEKYFAQKLVDYDPAVNNGNWQWCASTGCDAQPYFRIFNPWLQQKKFDSQCTYIKKWVPELVNVSAKTIHSWYSEKNPVIKGYPRPMVDHAIESKKTKLMYKKC